MFESWDKIFVSYICSPDVMVKFNSSLQCKCDKKAVYQKKKCKCDKKKKLVFSSLTELRYSSVRGAGVVGGDGQSVTL